MSATETELRICPSPEAPTHPFVDVTEDSFAYDDVTCIWLLGVTTGTSPTTYSPDRYVTREEMAAFMGRLYRAVTGLEAPIVPTPFTDLPTTSYAYEHLGRIYGLGITTGTGPTTYSPYSHVTREEIASFMARFYRAISGSEAPIVKTPFTDVPTDSFAYDDVARIYGLGLTTGTGPTEYSPERHMSREEMASFLARYYRLLPSPSELEILRRNALLTPTTRDPLTTQAPDDNDPSEVVPDDDNNSNDDNAGNDDNSGNDDNNGNNGNDDNNGNNGNNGNDGNGNDPPNPPVTTPPVTTPPVTTPPVTTPPITITPPDPSLNTPATCPANSASKRSIAFVRQTVFVERRTPEEGDLQSSNIGEIWIADDDDGTTPCQLTDTDGNSQHPAWSHNGSQIAYSTKTGNAVQIWVANANGSNSRQLTDSPDYGFNFGPAWSADGTKIAYRGYTARGDLDLFVMNADGSDQRQVSDTYHKATELSWSPDGTKIAFTKYGDANGRPGIPAVGAAEIWVMDVATGTAERLSAAGGHSTNPAWSPHSTPGDQKIAFTQKVDGIASIWAMDTDGSNKTKLIDGYATHPAWSPDGSRIAFSRWRETGYGDEIWVMDADRDINGDDDDLVQITNNPHEPGEGDWSYHDDRQPTWN